MPGGLIKTPEELRDLLAYLLSRGDKRNRMFAR